jgi:hypothetical protein
LPQIITSANVFSGIVIISTERTELLKSTPFRAAGTPTRDSIVGGAKLHNLRVSVIFLKDL